MFPPQLIKQKRLNYDHSSSKYHNTKVRQTDTGNHSGQNDGWISEQIKERMNERGMQGIWRGGWSDRKAVKYSKFYLTLQLKQE